MDATTHEIIIDIFHTGKETNWIFEVHIDRCLMGEGHDFKSHEEASLASRDFIKWLVMPVAGLRQALATIDRQRSKF